MPARSNTASAEGSSSRLHWDDIAVDHPVTHGAYEVTKDDIFAYARAYDPQPHHVDEEAAKLSLTKGLCASGWHSCAMFMRLFYDGTLKNAASLGAAGIDEVKWLKPVRPGFVLKLRTTCLEKRLMRSRPGVGIAKMKHEMLNQHDEVLMSIENSQFMGVRDPAKAVALETASPVSGPVQPKAAATPAAIPTNADMPKGNYFEDQIIGRRTELGRHTFTAADIKAFAHKFDPQPFHVDEEAAKNSLFGGLCASGWHTAAEFIGHMIRARQKEEEIFKAAFKPGGAETIAMWGPSPGFKNLKWPKPVMAGDTIRFRVTNTGKVDLKSRPERGMLLFLNEGFNQKDELVFQVTGQILVPRRVPLAG
jgi:acyl dehydratase